MISTNDGLLYVCNCASLGLDKLTYASYGKIHFAFAILPYMCVSPTDPYLSHIYMYTVFKHDGSRPSPMENSHFKTSGVPYTIM